MNNVAYNDAYHTARRHLCMRAYGAFCIGANVLLVLKGAAMHDPFVFVAGSATALAQGLNWAHGEQARPFTVPGIIAGAGIFAFGGLHIGNDAQMLFGSIKAAGVSILFYGKHIAARIRALPSVIWLMRCVPGLCTKKLGEIILGVAALALGLDGARQLMHGIDNGETLGLLSGSLTLLAVVGLIVGQRFAAMMPDKILA